MKPEVLLITKEWERMLVLSRREGESISLPGLDVEIRILKTKAGRVELGISAPSNIKIQRSELLAAVSNHLSAAELAEVASAVSVEVEIEAPSPAGLADLVRSEPAEYCVASA